MEITRRLAAQVAQAGGHVTHVLRVLRRGSAGHGLLGMLGPVEQVALHALQRPDRALIELLLRRRQARLCLLLLQLRQQAAQAQIDQALVVRHHMAHGRPFVELALEPGCNGLLLAQVGHHFLAAPEREVGNDAHQQLFGVDAQQLVVPRQPRVRGRQQVGQRLLVGQPLAQQGRALQHGRFIRCRQCGQVWQARKGLAAQPAVAPVREGAPQQGQQARAGRVTGRIAALGHLVQVVLRVVEHVAVGAAHVPVRVFLGIGHAGHMGHVQLCSRRHIPVGARHALHDAHQPIDGTIGHVTHQVVQDFLETLLLVAEGHEHQPRLSRRVAGLLAKWQRLAQQLAVVAIGIAHMGAVDMRISRRLRQDGSIRIAADHCVFAVRRHSGNGAPIKQEFLGEGE